jgi:hypothetical protein
MKIGVFWYAAPGFEKNLLRLEIEAVKSSETPVTI